MHEDQKQKVSESRFNMIRCIISIAHADGQIQPEERAFIDKMLSHLHLDASQKQTLDQDLQTAPSAIEMFDKIEDPKFKSQVLHFARMMAWKDNELDPGEQEVIEKLQAHASKSAGHDEAYKNLQNFMQTQDNQSDQPMPEKTDRQSLLSDFFDKILMR